LFLDDSLVVGFTPRLFIADSINHRVLEFQADSASVIRSLPSTQIQDSDGTPIGSSEVGNYHTPKSITIDTSQRIWISDSGNERLYVVNRLDSSEEAVFEGGGFNTSSPAIGEFGDVQGIASLGNTIYVADNYVSSRRVQKLVINDDWEITGTSSELTGYSFGYVVDVAAYSDGANTHVYALDFKQGRVAYFRNDVFQSSWGGIGSDNGQFLNPEGITVGADGQVYVADTGNHRIQVFSLTGTFVDKWGIEGSDAGEFSFPTDIVVGTDGTAYVSERGNARIQVFVNE
jgi:sugar lactone lactonase YvrE